MDNLTLALVATVCLAIYFYGQYTAYKWMAPFDLTHRDKMLYSVLWLPILSGVVVVLIILGLIFAIITPIVGLLSLAEFVYRRYTGRSFLIDTFELEAMDNIENEQ